MYKYICVKRERVHVCVVSHMWCMSVEGRGPPLGVGSVPLPGNFWSPALFFRPVQPITHRGHHPQAWDSAIETGFHTIIQSSLDLSVLLPQLPKCWITSCVSFNMSTFLFSEVLQGEELLDPVRPHIGFQNGGPFSILSQ